MRALGLCKAALAKLSQGWGFRDTPDLESCLGNLTFIVGAVEGFSPCLSSSRLPGFLGDALRGRSTLDNLHSKTRLLLGVIVTENTRIEYQSVSNTNPRHRKIFNNLE